MAQCFLFWILIHRTRMFFERRGENMGAIPLATKYERLARGWMQCRVDGLPARQRIGVGGNPARV
jgi:hypothetical protein